MRRFVEKNASGATFSFNLIILINIFSLLLFVFDFIRSEG